MEEKRTRRLALPGMLLGAAVATEAAFSGRRVEARQSKTERERLLEAVLLRDRINAIRAEIDNNRCISFNPGELGNLIAGNGGAFGPIFSECVFAWDGAHNVELPLAEGAHRFETYSDIICAVVTRKDGDIIRHDTYNLGIDKERLNEISDRYFPYNGSLPMAKPMLLHEDELSDIEDARAYIAKFKEARPLYSGQEDMIVVIAVLNQNPETAVEEPLWQYILDPEIILSSN